MVKPSGWGILIAVVSMTNLFQPGRRFVLQPDLNGFEKFELLLFRFTLLILFIVGLYRVIKAEVGW
jgi:hypothetical protein